MGANLILYGPPGTGKTYNTVIYAMSIITGRPVREVARDNYDRLLEQYSLLKNEYGQIQFTTFHQSYGYEEFVEGIKPIFLQVMNEKGERTRKEEMIYKVDPGAFRKFCMEANMQPDEKFVFIIDEINRGNISKIFGELITLIEPSKRVGQIEETTVNLAYSQEHFGVPDNIYILGTMNTADRSIAMLDTALRRRFDFIEMLPNPQLFKGITVEGVDICELLTIMNKRVEILLDRDHTIGHAYFMSLRSRPLLGVLAHIFKNSIIPLLQEYFYDDYEKMRLVLGDNNKPPEEQFIVSTPIDYNAIFGGAKDLYLENDEIYSVNNAAFTNIESYKKIF
ncbi:MAG: AAA family ATPase [Ruminococcus sp.]|jgi:5-methylcytosine-specific restriction protein B|nr:AAA family ATPase [Ruminococcus sp.]MDR0986398.1 AAA family ATPase [Ruminococcus sp.]